MSALKGHIAIVTSPNTYLGKELVKALLARNARVYIADHDRKASEETIRNLSAQTGCEAIYLKLDLRDLSSVKSAAREFLQKEEELHLLFNNASCVLPPLHQLTAQGYDLQFGVNTLGHFYLTTLLLPALRTGTKSTIDGKVRVINTTSSAAYFVNTIDFRAMVAGDQRRNYRASQLQGFSRLGSVIFAKEMARRYGSYGIISVSCNPGVCGSDLQGFLVSAMRPGTNSGTLSEGAATLLGAGMSPETIKSNGAYLTPWPKHSSPPPPGLHDEKLAADLWRWCELQCAKI